MDKKALDALWFGSTIKESVATDSDGNITPDGIAEMIGKEVLKGLKGRWDVMTDYDDGEYILSWGRSTDPIAMTVGEIVNAEKTITKVLAKHGLKGVVRIHAWGSKITFDVIAQ